ncbi:hypothetical protein FZEAL_3745 [Fusarium zealandicum]|uniref:C2H2-type domain-containing protein n=1 Tax=Fusarium zealandicum TaxID=1053134 RepID=A0A8H4UN49_9HYPO|nr:hypothetical protein FZEAL_3745 [Fusarium zealandicum]
MVNAATSEQKPGIEKQRGHFSTPEALSGGSPPADISLPNVSTVAPRSPDSLSERLRDSFSQSSLDRGARHGSACRLSSPKAKSLGDMLAPSDQLAATQKLHLDPGSAVPTKHYDETWITFSLTIPEPGGRAQSTGAPNWGRWSQQLSGDYTMMETSSMLPFDSRTNTAAPLQRPIMSPYMVPGSYSSSPMTTLTAPHYQAPHPYQFGGYHGPPTPPHHSSPFKVEYQERRLMGPESDNGRVHCYTRDTKYTYAEQAPSPARSDSQASTARSVSTNPALTAKTITSNATINPEDQVNFGTEVDELMKAIQRKHEKALEAAQHQHQHQHQQPLTPGMSPVSETSMDCQGTPVPADMKACRKRYVCNGPNCNKSFTQKTHLDIHRRTHTGDKPYICKFHGCKLTFSQLGNLKTHMRRHTGERPYSCDKCGRKFAQRGNVRAHEQTHQGLKPFVCRLDDCNKTFSQLGNMKTHQNNFHKNTLKNLTTRFAQVLSSGEEVPEADRELFEYFATHYKNSNKGIKGRGKARTVAERKIKASQSPPANPSTVTPQYSLPQTLPQIPPAQQIPNHHQAHGLSHPGSLAAYSMSRNHPNVMNNMPRESHAGGYDMYDMQGGHHHIQHSHNNGMLYEEDHAREMGFSDRMY